MRLLIAPIDVKASIRITLPVLDVYKRQGQIREKGEPTMNGDTWIFLALCGALLVFLLMASFLSKSYSLNNIKSKTCLLYTSRCV